MAQVQVRRSARIASKTQKRSKKNGKKSKATPQHEGSVWVEVSLPERKRRKTSAPAAKKATKKKSKSGAAVKPSNQQSTRRRSRASYVLENIPEEVVVQPISSPTDKDSCDELFSDVNLNSFKIPLDPNIYSQHLEYLKSKQPDPTSPQTIWPQYLNNHSALA
ncbi:hypothetical protein TRICI_001440 [Trichomonascus ciferrii]|uniref:Uncharacterized protein n=1 Tax=Trichomonascus ciferrii TaxID=44093 RepID=A0A642VAT3_9ASCO|nr:hypothetical protein TRICI_001440 [Trichomonascus ciferrii]